MLLHDLFENGGRIVPGVNTTVDVGPGEIRRQAKKWGWALSKDGIPQGTLWDSAKRLKPAQVCKEK